MVPGSFVPEEDQGYIFIANMMPDAVSLERTVAVSDQAVSLIKENPAMSDVAQLDGYSIIDSQNKTNAGLMFASLKPYEERKGKEGTAFAVVADARKKYSRIKEGVVIPLNPPSIPGLGTTGGFEFYIQSKGSGNPQDLEKVIKAFIAKARERKELTGISYFLGLAAAALSRPRPRPGRDSRRAGLDGLRNVAGLLRLFLHLPVHPVRPHLAGDHPGPPGIP
jgi:multidrug efflux pump